MTTNAGGARAAVIEARNLSKRYGGKLADRQSQTIPSKDPDYGDLGPAFHAWTSSGQEPILQPPKPEIPPSPRILERAMDRDADWEAAD